MRFILFWQSIFISIFFWGCTTSGKSNSSVKQDNGQIQCGGAAGIQCPGELYCKVKSTGADGFGVCIQVEKCAGLAGTKCLKGFSCVRDAELPPEIEGVCLEQERCGGVAGLICPDRMVCKTPNAGPADGFGYCIAKIRCAGPQRLGCPDGLACQVLEGRPANSYGVCL